MCRAVTAGHSCEDEHGSVIGQKVWKDTAAHSCGDAHESVIGQKVWKDTARQL